MENIPLSYALSFNVDKSRYDNDIIEDMEYISSEAEYDYYIIYRVDKDPKTLIDTFCNDICRISKYKRNVLHSIFAPLCEYLSEWFEEKGLSLDLSQHGESQNVVSIDQQEIDEDVDIEAKMLQYRHEIRVVTRPARYLDTLQLMGFNSSGYDFPLIKSMFFPSIQRYMEHPEIDITKIKFIKKTSKYVSVSIHGLKAIDDGSYIGSLAFLDVMQYLAPGFTLDNFCKSFCTLRDENEKFVFPYEFLTSYERLEDEPVPEYRECYSYLKQCNILHEEFEQWAMKNSKILYEGNDELPKRRADISEDIVVQCKPPIAPYDGHEK